MSLHFHMKRHKKAAEKAREAVKQAKEEAVNTTEAKETAAVKKANKTRKKGDAE